jgi:hypothetical protein
MSTDKNFLKSKTIGKKKKSMQVAQKRGTEILQVSNPTDPLNASNREKSVP